MLGYEKIDVDHITLGGQSFTKLGLADDQHDWGPDAIVDPWTIEMWTNLMALHPFSSEVSCSKKNNTLVQFITKLFQNVACS